MDLPKRLPISGSNPKDLWSIEDSAFVVFAPHRPLDLLAQRLAQSIRPQPSALVLDRLPHPSSARWHTLRTDVTGWHPQGREDPPPWSLPSPKKRVQFLNAQEHLDVGIALAWHMGAESVVVVLPLGAESIEMERWIKEDYWKGGVLFLSSEHLPHTTLSTLPLSPAGDWWPLSPPRTDPLPSDLVLVTLPGPPQSLLGSTKVWSSTPIEGGWEVVTTSSSAHAITKSLGLSPPTPYKEVQE
ncbi:hypothetical protein H8D30_03945 [bacterium]|nr:hypothetical protein [bacterium]